MLLSFGDAASLAQQRREGQLSPGQIAQKALGAVVVIKATDDLKRYRYGSGFFVKNNLIATNYHVVKGLSRISAQLVGRNKEYACSLVVQDEENDLAVLRVQGFDCYAKHTAGLGQAGGIFQYKPQASTLLYQARRSSRRSDGGGTRSRRKPIRPRR